MRYLVIIFAGLLLIMSPAAMHSTLRAEETAELAPAKSDDSERVAQQLLALSDAVLARHFDPPTRQQMYLAGTKALFKAAGVRTTPEPSRRISTLSSKEEFLQFTKEIWRTAAMSHDGSHEELVAAMESGFLSAVPGGVRLISANELKIQSQLQGNRYVGVGIALGYDKELKLPQIIDRFARGPAHKAGIQRGDLIVEVDGNDIQGMPLQDVVQLLRGEEGTSVSMAVRQPDASETRRCEITRGVVPRETIVGFERSADDEWNYRPDSEAPIGYVRIKEITSSTLHELRAVERRLTAEGVRALVLDLRGNPGGRMHDHVSVANSLLNGGTIARTRVGERLEKYEADRDCLFRDWPIMLLTDRRVAGGVEALAAALQDQKRVVVVGEPTAGWGFIRTAMPLPGGEGSLIMPVGVLERADGTPLVPPTRQRSDYAMMQIASSDDVKGRVRWRVEPDHRILLADGKLAQFRRAFVPSGDAVDEAPDDRQLTKALELLKTQLGQAAAS